MSEQVPSIGRTVQYRLSLNDVEAITRRRTTGASIAERMQLAVPSADGNAKAIYGWPTGAQAHIGTAVAEGDVFPMLIVRVWGPTATSAVNGQVFLDGTDVFWATSRSVGEGPGTFSWPVRT